MEPGPALEREISENLSAQCSWLRPQFSITTTSLSSHDISFNIELHVSKTFLAPSVQIFENLPRVIDGCLQEMISEEVFTNCSAGAESWEICGAAASLVSLNAEREKHVYIFNQKVETQREKIE